MDPRQRRDSSRHSLQRATTAVAIVILTILLLALAAVWQSLRATRLQKTAISQQHRAESAEQRARSDLWRALLAETKATRLGQTIARRGSALDTIRRAAAIAPSAELRNEAVATLALPEHRLEASIPIDASVHTFEFDHEMRRCALGLTNGDVILLRASDATEIRRLRLVDGPVPAGQNMAALLEFAPGGVALAVRYLRGAFAVWDVGTGRMKFLRDADQRRRPASRALFSSDGKFIVAPVFTPDGFEVMNAETGQTVAHFPGVSSFHHAAVRPGVHQFAAYDGTQVLWFDWDTQRLLADFPFDAGARSLAWSPNGRLLAIVGNQLNVHLWDVERHQVRQLYGHKDDIVRAVFDPSGDRLATTALDGTSRLWDLRDERLLGVASDRRLIQWGPENRTGWVVPKERLEVRRQFPSNIYTPVMGIPEQGDSALMDISSDGKWAVSKAKPDGLLVWDLEQSGRPERIPLADVQSLCFMPGEAQLLLIRHRALEVRSITVQSQEGRPRLSLSEALSLPAVPGQRVDSVVTSLDGQTRAFVDLLSGRVWVEHVGPAHRIVELQNIIHNGSAYRSSSPRGTGTLALSPDGRWLACGADGFHGTQVFDTSSGKALVALDEATGGVQFSPDGRWLVLAGVRVCQLFRTSDWHRVWSRNGDTFSPNYSGAAAFSPDGTWLAFVQSARNAALMETATGRELTLLESPGASPLNTLRWTADSRRLVAATRENSLDVWQPTLLHQELAALGLDWDVSPINSTAGSVASAVTGTDSTQWISLGLLMTASVVSGVALLSLRRHRRLIEDFSRTEARAQQWERELQVEREFGRVKNGFVTMVTHEFRTPLGIIQSSAQILDRYLDRLTPADRGEQLGSITKSVRRMSNLIDEVLLLGQSDAGQLRFDPAPLDLAGFARRITDEMLSATHRACPIQLTLAPLPSAIADENLLRHILSNLISNAVKYSTPGSPVTLDVHAAGEDAILTVEDQGLGIPSVDHPKIFTSFHRGANVGEVRGTGLGLSIVKRCVELHGGRIGFESTENKGTKFTVRLPLFRSQRDRPIESISK